MLDHNDRMLFGLVCSSSAPKAAVNCIREPYFYSIFCPEIKQKIKLPLCHVCCMGQFMGPYKLIIIHLNEENKIASVNVNVRYKRCVWFDVVVVVDIVVDVDDVVGSATRLTSLASSAKIGNCV